MTRLWPILMLMLCAGGVFAQSSFTVQLQVTPVAQLAATGSQTLVLDTPLTAGAAPVTVATGSSALLYTATVSPGMTRRITAATAGPLPPGTKLEVQVTPATGGVGERGAGLGYVTLGATPTDVLQSIGGSASGASGATVDYRLSVQNQPDLRAAVASVSVVYTLTAEGAP